VSLHLLTLKAISHLSAHVKLIQADVQVITVGFAVNSMRQLGVICKFLQ
jgi:hypothetical protein